MKNHKFHSKDNEGIWIVECLKTKGSFSTKLWKDEKIPNQTCPCCGEVIK